MVALALYFALNCLWLLSVSGNYSTCYFFCFSGAMAEEEKKKHAGDDFEKSIRNVMDAQKSDFSKNFPKSKKLPGIVRSLQEKPFKIMLGNYDQL